ncbi:malonyl-CoA decarboxylase [Rhodobacteraceae bacterium LMO-12]|nr:malonyl-CoA decarboxylase [Rhodobacteraceae bacterium LMO-JJ12]
MVQNTMLGDMLASLFERRRASGTTNDPRPIEKMCQTLLTSEGEVFGIHLAKAILTRYAELDQDAKLAFFRFLNDALEMDAGELRNLAQTYLDTGLVADYHAITVAAEPRRQELFRRLNQPAGATAKLVAMRVDLLGFLKDHPELKRTDFDFVHLLRSWFNRGFLMLKQISWDTPASILEKIVEYEAVHAINDWEDLRRRLYPSDRRCFAYFHPTMPDEPLIFVEVALTKSVPDSIHHVLAENRTPHPASDTNVAVFYSISNCQDGLQGVSFGNLLIKQVVEELRQQLPQLDTFITLSPVPGFNKWLATKTDSTVASQILAGEGTETEVEAAVAHYLLNEKGTGGRPRDPVARFHLGNGAVLHEIHANADLTAKGREQSSGAMVNYLYDLKKIEKNHEQFVLGKSVPASKSVASKATAFGALQKAEPAK